MSSNPQLTDDEDINDQLSIPTSGSEGISTSPKSVSFSTSESEPIVKSAGTPSLPLIVSDIQAISDDINLLNFVDHRISCNAPEKIIIALDISSDEDVTPFQDNSNNNFSPLSLLKRSVETFVHLKSSLNGKNEFALVLLEENKATWFLNFTSNVKEVLKALNSVNQCNAEDIFDLTSLFNEVHKKVIIPNFNRNNTIPPPYVVRIILLYNRSYTCPKVEFTEIVKEMLDSPFFTLDVLVSHEPIDAGNNCEKIFSTLQNIDKKGYSYFFSVGREINALMKSMGKLLGHPLQRPTQKIANYSIT